MQFYVLVILSSMAYLTNQNKGNKVWYIEIAAKCYIIEYTDEDLDRIYEQWEENERKEQEEVPVM